MLRKVLTLSFFLLLSAACSGKYLIKSYPTGAKIYTRDIKTNEKKLVGVSPVQIPEESKLGDVFFVVFEKQNYRAKEVMVRVNEGESISVAAQLDPMTPEEVAEAEKNSEKKDDQKPQGKPEDKKKKKDDLEQTVEDLLLRVALLENTVTFYKDAMFSARFQGNGSPKWDRDRGDKAIDSVFKAQQAIMSSNFAEAQRHLDEALEQDEYMSRAWLLKGSLAYLMKDYPSARRYWERTLKLDPHDKIAYKYLAQVYKLMGVSNLPPKPAELRQPASRLEIDARKGEFPLDNATVPGAAPPPTSP